MRKIKGKGTIVKAITSSIGVSNRKFFENSVTDSPQFYSLVKSIQSNININIDIVTFSSSKVFYEQVLSILSFVKFVGTPSFWTIYSDGTLTDVQINMLKYTFSFIKIVNNEYNDLYYNKTIKKSMIRYKDILISYAKISPWGKKLFFYLNYPIVRSTLFLDADVLFYERASCLRDLIKENYTGWYLPDAEWESLDSRFKSITSIQHYQVNAGFFLINKELKYIDKGLDFLKSLLNSYEYFSEQTVMHILLTTNNFMPLDPRIFILDSSDQFDFSYLKPFSAIAIRHYTSPVRHKMWQANWKKHLNIK